MSSFLKYFIENKEVRIRYIKVVISILLPIIFYLIYFIILNY